MEVRICDKCKKQYGTFPEQAVHFPIVNVNVTQSYSALKVDLCSDCQKAVYDFIFGKEEEE